MNELAEKEANLIAYHLLMPRASTKKLIEEGKTVEEIADYFGAPESAVVAWVVYLGYKPFESIY